MHKVTSWGAAMLACAIVLVPGAPGASPDAQSKPIVVFDNDADFDDTVALRARIAVILDGISSGRTVEDPSGALMWVGFSANQALFESTLIRVLNGMGDGH